VTFDTGYAPTGLEEEVLALDLGFDYGTGSTNWIQRADLIESNWYLCAPRIYILRTTLSSPCFSKRTRADVYFQLYIFSVQRLHELKNRIRILKRYKSRGMWLVSRRGEVSLAYSIGGGQRIRKIKPSTRRAQDTY
jgi:hypothetical protein